MKSKILALLLPIVLAGCASSMVEPINKEVDKDHANAAKLAALARKPQPLGEQQRTQSTERVSGLWFPTTKLPAVDAPLNETLSRNLTVNRPFQNIQEVAERINSLTGVTVNISPEAAQALTPTGVTGAQTAVAGAPVTGLPPLPAPNMVGVQGATFGMPIAGTPLVYTGKLAGFLDVVSARYGVSWEWSNNAVRFYRTATKTFRITALPGDTTLNAKISNSSGGSTTGTAGSSGASSQEAGVSFAGLSVWKSIEDSIKTMLTTSGKVIVTPATGTVTITDTPQVLAQVEKFIGQQNISLGRQVVVNVKVLAVDLSNTDEYGINWDVAYSSLSGNLGWTLQNAFTADPSASTVALKILSTAGSATNANIKAWAGSQAIIDALSKQGRVSQITSASITTLNNQPAPIQVGRQTSYLASSSTTIGTAGAPSVTTLTPGLITTGFSMNLVPHMMDEKRLLLQYAMDLSSLIRLTTVTSGGSSIQTPELETRNFLQRVMLNTGDTLVVTGFEQSTISGDMQGIGDPSNLALGGGLTGSRAKTILVVLIQPVIADR